MTDQKRVYAGVFLDVDSRNTLLSAAPPKHPEVHAGHVTLAFGRHMMEEYPIGRVVMLEAIAELHDERGQCIVIRPDNLKDWLWEGQQPHITISCAKGIRPIYSNELMKSVYKGGMLEKPIKLLGFIDYFPRTVA